MEIITGGRFSAILDTSVGRRVDVSGQNLGLRIRALHLHCQDKFFDFARNGLLGTNFVLGQPHQLLSNRGAALCTAVAKSVINASPQNAADVKTTVVEEIFVLDCDGCQFNGNRNILVFDGDTFDTVDILPEQGLAGTVIVHDAAADIFTGDIGDVRQILAKISKQADQYDKTGRDADARNFEGHNAAFATEPVMVEPLGL